MKKGIVLVLCLMLGALMVGCGGVAEEVPAVSAEVVSEVVSEEVSEHASEEPSEEIVSEEVSEESEIVDGVQTIYCDSYEEMATYFDELEEPVIVVFKFSQAEKGQALLYNGSHYTMPENFFLRINVPKEIEWIDSDAEYLLITSALEKDIVVWNMGIETTGTDIEVPLTIVYTDGTEENITVYITKEWEG